MSDKDKDTDLVSIELVKRYFYYRKGL